MVLGELVWPKIFENTVFKHSQPTRCRAYIDLEKSTILSYKYMYMYIAFAVVALSIILGLNQKD